MGDISLLQNLWPASFDGPIGFPMINLVINPSTTVFGTGIHWYGLIIAIGLVAAMITCMKLSEKYGLTQDNILDVIIFGAPSAVICARLYYVIFSWDSYKNHLADIFKIWQGGIAIYGAIIGGIIAVVVYCRVKKISFFKLADVCSIGVVIGQIIGRWGNFINREAFGAPTGDRLLWRMRLYTDASLGTWIDVHPTFLYESLWNVGVLILLLNVIRKKKFDGQVFWTYLMFYGLGRFFIEGLRTDSLYLGSFRVSQIIALGTFVAGAVLLIINLKKIKPAQTNATNK